ncbi:MAG: AMP-binding protein [Bacteroidales bacterium]|nr:AMP-binding protein [Bacteroidales bacterium]
MKETEKPTRMFDLLDDRDLILRYVKYIDGTTDLQKRDIRRRDYRGKSDMLSHALLHRGLRRGETVGIISATRPECAYINLGIMQIGAIPLELEDNLTAEQYIAMLGDARIIFVEDAATLARMRLIAPQLDSLRLMVSIDSVDGSTTLEQLLDEGYRHADRNLLQRRRNLISTDEVCSLEYRGGTNRTPLSHKAMLSAVLD